MHIYLTIEEGKDIVNAGNLGSVSKMRKTGVGFGICFCYNKKDVIYKRE